MVAPALIVIITALPLALTRRFDTNKVSVALDRADTAERESVEVSDESLKYLGRNGQNASLGNKSELTIARPWESLISAPTKTLGEGAFGAATLHRILGDECKGAHAVVKTISYNSLEECGEVGDEISIMAELRHNPHIIRIFDYSPRPPVCQKGGGTMNLLMEAAMGGELEVAFNKSAGGISGDKGRFFRYVLGGMTGVTAKRRERKSNLLKMVLYDLSDGLKEMHSKGFIHRDIKPANIWKAGGSADSCVDSMSCRFVLGDLGLAKRIDIDDPEFAGTDFYVPPEVVSRHSWSRAGDVWALGASILSMMAGPKYLLTSFMFNTSLVDSSLRKHMDEIRTTIRAKPYIQPKWKELLFDMVKTEDDRPSAEVVHQRAEALLTPEEKTARDDSKTRDDASGVPCLENCLVPGCPAVAT